MNAAELAELQAHLTPAELAELEALVGLDMQEAVWRPLPGPQSMAYYSRADITGYGGAAGGGKTDLIAGLTQTVHSRCLVVRREKAQTEGVIQRLAEIRGGTDGLNSQKGIWQTERGLIEFAGLDNPGDEKRWQGRPHDLKCVAAGTFVWMADGTRKVIEQVQVGDMVDTLDGPRAVTRTMRSERAAVTVSAWLDGVSLGWQTQGATHELLGAWGWRASAPCLAVPASRTESLRRHTGDESCEPTCSCALRSAAGPMQDLPPAAAPRICHPDRQSSSESPDGMARTRPGIAPAALNARSAASAQPALCRPPLGELGQPAHGSGVSGRQLLAGAHGDCDVPAASSPADYRERCSCGTRRGDGQPRLPEDVAPPASHQLDGAAPQSPTCWLVDAPGNVPRRSRPTWSYLHPYSTETRCTDRPVRAVVLTCADAGFLPLFDLTVDGANHYVTGPGFINRNCFDEATEMREHQVRFVMGWNRTNTPSVLPRTVFTFNPPTTAEGRWVIPFFGPWLDTSHPLYPTPPGELRYCAMLPTANGMSKDVWVDADNNALTGQSFVLVNNQVTYDFNPADYRMEDIITPKSRTFIPARLTDNPYYLATGYMSQLQALPEPLRSQMLNGSFTAGMQDDPWAVCPTAWVQAAMDRWRPRAPRGEMLSMGVDVARGGKDNTVIATRHQTPDHPNWFDQIAMHPGKETPDGQLVAGLVMASVRDGSPVHIDVIGVGASPYDLLRMAGQPVYGVNVAEGSTASDRSGRLKFFNLRSQLWWQFRELLDPQNDTGVCLPPDKDLLAELCAPKWSLSGMAVKVQGREDIMDTLGRSPDRATAVILAAMDTPKMRNVRRADDDRESVVDYDPYNS